MGMRLAWHTFLCAASGRLKPVKKNLSVLHNANRNESNIYFPFPKLIKENCQLSLLFVFAVSFYSQAEKQDRVNGDWRELEEMDEQQSGGKVREKEKTR